MRAATNKATHTTAFLTRRLPVVSRTGRTEYQLLLMKASDRGRKVKFLGNNFGCVLSKLTNSKKTVVYTRVNGQKLQKKVITHQHIA